MHFLERCALVPRQTSSARRRRGRSPATSVAPSSSRPRKRSSLPGGRSRPVARREGRVHRGAHPVALHCSPSAWGRSWVCLPRAFASSRPGPAARHREALRSGRGLEEAGGARRRGVRARPEARDLGRLAPQAVGVLVGCPSTRSGPPRAVGRQRLPRRRYRALPRDARARRLRRLRRPPLGARLPRSVDNERALVEALERVLAAGRSALPVAV